MLPRALTRPCTSKVPGTGGGKAPKASGQLKRPSVDREEEHDDNPDPRSASQAPLDALRKIFEEDSGTMNNTAQYPDEWKHYIVNDVMNFVRALQKR